MEQTKQYEYVDLGLPSGLKWAKCNLGAETETDYGDYFMWGSITPNTDTPCNWKNAPFNNGASDYDEEYFTTHILEWLDDKDNLKPEFDAATQIMGGDWRMPTRDEIQELFDNTKYEWIEGFNNSEVDGWKITSKTETSKYIFFPVAGYCLDGSVYNVGSGGYVWCSSLYTSNPYYARSLFFSSLSCFMGFCLRFYGRSVRGVKN